MVEQPILRHGGLGVASFVISIVVLPLLFVLIGVAAAIKQSGGESQVNNMLIGFDMISLWVVNLAGIGLGIAGAVDKSSKKVFPVLGLVFGIATILLSVGMVAYGLRISGRI